MRKFGTILPVSLLLVLAAVRVHAQIDGCADSPENPTLVLGLIVSAASIGFTQIRRRLRTRNDADRK